MKTILITGSTDGIGKQTAIQLAAKGHLIYIHGRNFEKVSVTILEIKRLVNNENIKGFVADFSDLDAVRKMAENIKAENSKIDILINNAGVYNSTVLQNKDGLDIRFMVNYFAPFVLTNELLPLLQNNSDSRIINLSSAAQSSVDFEALKGNLKLSAGEAYAQSKLALTMWSFYLAYKQQNISVIPVNPGSLLNTKMANEAFGTHWSSVYKGVDILSELAVSEKYKGVSGKYFDNDKGDFNKAHSDAYNKEIIHKVIELTKQLTSIELK